MMNGTALHSEEEVANKDKEVALKVLGGFGCRVHYGDVNYAVRINQMLDQLVAVSAQDIECIICVAKVRVVKDHDDAEADTFRMVGGEYGTEVELTALHAMVAADLRTFRARIAKKMKEAEEAVQGKH